MENSGMKMAPEPMQSSVGEMIETIERQQADLYGMANEIKNRLTDSPEMKESEPKPKKPIGYLNRLAIITDCNREVLTTLENIMRIL